MSHLARSSLVALQLSLLVAVPALAQSSSGRARADASRSVAGPGAAVEAFLGGVFPFDRTTTTSSGGKVVTSGGPAQVRFGVRGGSTLVSFGPATSLEWLATLALATGSRSSQGFGVDTEESFLGVELLPGLRLRYALPAVPALSLTGEVSFGLDIFRARTEATTPFSGVFVQETSGATALARLALGAAYAPSAQLRLFLEPLALHALTSGGVSWSVQGGAAYVF